MIKVFIADDHALIREGIKKLVNATGTVKVVGETGEPYKLVEMLGKVKCDVLILDLSMPGKSGLDLLKEIKAALPEMKILIMTMMPEDQFAKRTLKAGAAGYLTKGSDPEELITAIVKIASGRKYITPSLAEKLAQDLDNDFEKPLHNLLSDREFQIMEMIASGKSQTDIAGELSISISTVNTYRSRVLKKLNLNSTAELIHFAFRNGFNK